MALSIQESDFDAQVMKSREVAGLRLIDGRYSAKTKVPLHSHDRAVFCVALTGICTEVFAGKVRSYEASTVEFLPPEQCHAIDFPFVDTRTFSIDISSPWLDQAREFSLKVNESVHCHGGLLAGLMMKVFSEFYQVDDASPLAIQGLALEMLAAVSRESNVRTVRPQRWLKKASEFLRESFTERLTIAEVATAAGVHPVYLAREFRRFHGCTIGEYIRRLRVERACRQLSSSHESLAAIAAGAGFSDQSHFCRTFKRLVGVTPARYRANFESQ
ncbi:MAG TPA: AraC family transcriptional regulator [Pyrinomonadaceae bacterium]|nr:AraC family transcriptional regulator [Pyrinomonadaceae bacterium]